MPLQGHGLDAVAPLVPEIGESRQRLGLIRKGIHLAKHG